ncbi:MAG: sugar porter family MFS transporter [Ekhidna sp.]
MKKNNLLLITVIASLGGLLFGYDTGVINGTQFYFSKYFELTDGMKGNIVSSALYGCVFGAVFSGFVSGWIGRKKSLIISALLFTISAWGSGLPSFLPESLNLLIFFRFIGGVGIGVASMNAPMYIAEISPSAKRGKMVTFYQMAIVTGFFVVFLATYLIGNSGDIAYRIAYGWRVMFWSELIPCGLFLILLFFVPKSPRWLVLKGRNEEAKELLEKMHDADVAAKEFNQITESVEKSETSSLSSLIKKPFLFIVLVGTSLSVLQQFTGINAVLYYGADIFEKALGFGEEDILVQQILLAGVNFGFTFLAMFTVDKWGRKPLIIAGSVGMIVGFGMLSFTLMTETVGLLSLLGILIFIGSFAMSMGPVVWVLLSEMFPNRIRGIGMSIAVAAQWLFNGIVAQTFPRVMGSELNNSAPWNGSLPYFIFMGFIAFTIFLTMKFIPETKGKSLEELENVWEH